MSDFWSFWVIAIVTINLGLCAFLLIWVAKPIDNEPALGESMGHSYDGIEEYNNPMPRWWIGLFWATIVFAIGYLVLYPGYGKWAGVLGWTAVNQYEAEMKAADEKYAPIFNKFAAMPIEQVAADPEAHAMGQRLFLSYCAVCHGASAKGARGFPNLTDNDWLYGGEPATIEETITNGRHAGMPAWGSVLGEEGVNEVAFYVASLSRPESAAGKEDLVQAGAAKFQTNCVMCHGADAKGNHAFGAPNLTDNTWLYGGSVAVIKETITGGRQGQMPAQHERLSAAKIHLLAAYVYSLSHPQ